MGSFDWDRHFVHGLAAFIVAASFVLLGYSLIVLKDQTLFQTVGQVTFGVVGTIVGFYFNHQRLVQTQRQLDSVSEDREKLSDRAAEMTSDLEQTSTKYAQALLDLGNLIEQVGASEGEEEAENGQPYPHAV
jgi:hypothetical protein